MNSKPVRPETLALGKKRQRKAAPLKEMAKKAKMEDSMVTVEVPQSKELESLMQSLFGTPPAEGPTSTGEMVLDGMAKIEALEKRLSEECVSGIHEKEEEEKGEKKATVTDLSCPVHPWEPLCPGSSDDFWYERCGKEGCLVFIPTQHLDVMLKELKDRLHPTLKEQWDTLRCECGLRPRMKLSLSEKNYQKVYLTCGVNRRGVEEFGKVRCRYFQWIHCKPRKVTVVPLEDNNTRSQLFEGAFVVGGRFNTIGWPEEFRNLDSRKYLHVAFDAMKAFPEWKTELYLAALTRYLKEEKREEVVEIVRGLKEKHAPNTYSVLYEEALEAAQPKKPALRMTCDC